MVKVFCFKIEREDEIKMMILKNKWKRIEFDLNGVVLFEDDIYMILFGSFWKFCDDMLFVL